MNVNLRRRNLSLVADVERMLVEKYPYQEIKDRVLLNVQNDETQFNLIYRLALDRFSEGYTQSRGFYTNQSVTRYEEEIRRLLNQTYEGENAVGMKIYSYLMVLDTLRDLEVLLGFRTTRVKIRVNNIIYRRTQKVATITNFQNLSIEEKQRLLLLLDKSKLSELETIKPVTKSSESTLEEENIKEEITYTQFEEITVNPIEEEEQILPREDVLHKGLVELQKRHIDESYNI